MSNNPNDYKNNIAIKRMQGMVSVWDKMIKAQKANPTLNIVDSGLFTLNYPLAAKVARYYARDLDILKRRYNIKNRARTPKLAGLMANAILRYRPLVPVDGMNKAVKIGSSKINELFAIYHGIIFCASYGLSGNANNDDGNKAMYDLIGKPMFKSWVNDFVYLLKERDYTSESLIMVFETLCMAVFPQGFTTTHD